MAKTFYRKIGPFQFCKCGSVVRFAAWGKDPYLKIGSIHYFLGIKFDLRFN